MTTIIGSVTIGGLAIPLTADVTLPAVTPPAVTPPPVGPGMLIGARGKGPSSQSLTAAFAGAESNLGNLQVTRVFYGTLPAKHARISDPGVLEIISYKGSGGTANLTAFCRSLTAAGPAWLAKHHEPEGPTDYADGAAFLADWQPDYDVAHSLGVTFGMIAGGYQYRANGGNGFDGSYLPARADFYSIDTYRDGSADSGFGAIVTLDQVAEFQRWYTLVKDRGAPLAVTEYGRGTVGNGEVASTPQKRVAVLGPDVQWLRDHGFAVFSLWYSNYGPDGRAWCPTDSAWLTAFQALTRG